MSAIVLSGVTKRYGRALALNKLSLTVPTGTICALIGPNGAGKTTTMGLVAGLLAHDEGDINILGSGPFDAAAQAGRLGVMPQDSTPSSSLSIRRSLRFYGELQGLSKADAAKEASLWLERVGLSDRATHRYGSLSHGMRRRFSVAQAFLGNPELVLLDEPTSGLDPELVVQIRDLIVERRGSATVLVSSHILSELESMCDHAVILEKGECVSEGPMKSLTGKEGSETVTRIRTTGPVDTMALASALDGITCSYAEPTLTVRDRAGRRLDETLALVLRHLLDAGVGIEEVSSGESLEDAYLASKK